MTSLALTARMAKTEPKYLIDCDADPQCPPGYYVAEHRKYGLWEWDPATITRFQSPLQRRKIIVVGYQLRRELLGKPVANACVLDHLLAHEELIPEEWKQRAGGSFPTTILFLGTLFTSVENPGITRVRGLHWSNYHQRWSTDMHWLGNAVGCGNCYVALHTDLP